ncbi:MAG TPA: hypothetical protein VFN21_13255 [Acidimicrobiales bacterium]|nr:hypothetical protein [Acidimicrobiales bacterium]
MTDTFPGLSPGVLGAASPRGGVVYDLVSEQLSLLNASGAALLAACADRSDRTRLLDAWSVDAGVPIAQLCDEVDDALAEFHTAGFIGRSDPSPRIHLPDAPVTPLDDGEGAATQSAGVHRIRFRSSAPALVDMVDDLLGLASSDEPTADFHLVPEADGTIRLVTDTEWCFADRDELVGRLVMVVNDFVARTTTDIVLHAAALRSPRGEVVVFPAAPSSGKSTLAGVLVQHGWAYLGDESVTIRADDLAVAPCAKPLGLDEASCAVLGLDLALAGDVGLDLVASGAIPVTDPCPSPTAIVVPSYVGPEGSPSRELLDFDAALVTLVGNALNLRYVGSSGLETLVTLAASVPVHSIAYRTSDEAVTRLSDLGFDS